ncbi:hypothetical protein BGX34_005633, partial [Mortierella sp. NVP85]
YQLSGPTWPLYASEECWSEAVQFLMGIPLDSVHRLVVSSRTNKFNILEILATFYKDDHLQRLLHFSILKKMYLDCVFGSNEVSELAGTLKQHQLAILPYNTTVL